MTTSIRHSVAAIGAATVMGALGAFASIAPASASPAGPPAGSPGGLSGNVVHAQGTVTPMEGTVDVEPITQQEFNSHGDDEYTTNCAQVAALKYCEYPDYESTHGTKWDAYIAIPAGTTLDATVTIVHSDDLGDGNDVAFTAPVHADSPYVHLSAGMSPWEEDELQSQLSITLSDGTSYQTQADWIINDRNIEFSGEIHLYPN